VHTLTLDVKTKALIAAVAVGIVVGQVVTFLGGPANTTGWDVVKVPCECAWVVLAFPLGWLGLIAGAFAKIRWLLPYPNLFLWIGIPMNGGLWALMVYLAVRFTRGQGTHRGFDAPTVSLRLTEVRRNYVAAGHARTGSVFARKGLVATASRAVRRCRYFFDRKPEARPYAQREMHKNEP
jgi:hypothetical protein